MPRGGRMRTHESTPEGVLPQSRSLRESQAPGVRTRFDELGDVVVQSEALYLGPRSGENGVDGVVVRVPNGSYRVVATVDETADAPTLVAVSVVLSATDEAQRAVLPGAAFWHEAPGDLPLVSGAELIVCDAGLRDQYRDPSWPWSGWLADVVAPELASARTASRVGVAIPFAGRAENLIALAPITGDATLFAGFDADLRPSALHLEPLTADDAPPPWIVATPPSTVAESVAEADASLANDDASPFRRSTFQPPAEAPASDEAGLPDADDSDRPIFANPLGGLAEDEPVDRAGPDAAPAHTPFGAAAAPTAPPAFIAPPTTPAPAAEAAPVEVPSPQPPAPVAEPDDPGARMLVDDAVAGIEAAQRGDGQAAIPLLSQVTEALAAGVGDRPAVRAGLSDAGLIPAHIADELTDALIAADRTPEAVQRLRAVLEADQFQTDEIERLHLRHRLGALQLQTGDAETAAVTLESARADADLLRHNGDEHRDRANAYSAQIAFDLATAMLETEHATPAAELAADAMRSFEELGEPRMAGRSAFLAASAYDAVGHEASRQHAIAEAERIFRAGDEPDGLGTALGYLGEADARRGDYTPAAVKFEQARQVLEQAGAFSIAAIAAENEAVCYDYLGDAASAADRRRVAAELAARADAPGPSR